MSTDPNKWLKTLPNLNKERSIEKNTLDPNIWVGTISKGNTKQPNTKKYSLLIILLIIGLMSVPITKNATRDLQNEISNLHDEISILKLELHQTNLDFDFITSPTNISLLAKENLGPEFNFYKKSQVLKFSHKENTLAQLKIDTSLMKEKVDNKTTIQKIVLNEIKKKKINLNKIKKISLNPKEIPNTVKSHVTKKIKNTEKSLKKLYSSPGEVITPERTKRWAAIQLVKAFFGFPVIPGR